MKKLLSLLLCGAALLSNAQEDQYVPGDILAMLAPDVAPATVVNDLGRTLGTAVHLEVAREVSLPMRTWLFQFDPSVRAQEEVLRAFRAHPKVQLAQNNHLITYRNAPNDAQYGQQWQHQNIDSELAWDITTGGLTATGDTIVVCVLENCDLPHPDLVANAWYNHQEIPGNGQDDDGNGYVDDFQGWNTQAQNDNVYGGSHGTQVAGMIGAVGNNGTGVSGINWNVKIMVVEFGGVQEAEVVAAYTYPWVMRKMYRQTQGGKGAFVVSTNASWGIDGGQPANAPLWCAIYDSLGTEGILNCGATANQSYDVDQVGDLPTACPSDFMISVTATDVNDTRTFSAWGLTTIDVGAPGASVYTTSLGGGYGSTSGTSFASPLTAGIIGLLYSVPCTSLMDLVNSDPEAGALYIRQALFTGVEQVGNLPGNTVTGGRVNVHNSLQWLIANCGSCPTPYGTSLTDMGGGSVLFSWNSTGSGPFTVQYAEAGSGTWTTLSNIINTSFMATGLQPCTSYEFQVAGACDTVTSAFTNSLFTEVPVEPVPTIALSGADMFCDGGSVTLTSSAVTGNTWSTGDTTQSITVGSTGSYTVTVDGPCNSATSTAQDISVLALVDPVASGINQPGPGVATLTAMGDSITWYDAPGGTVVGTGNSWDTPFLWATTDYWCTNTTTYGGGTVYGGMAANTANGQYHNNGNNWIRFTAAEAFWIRSVKVYANGAGARQIGLVDANGTTVMQGSFTVPDGESRVQLDFLVPGPGDYGLRIMTGNPQLWRDGPGSNPAYPFALGTYGTITSSTVAAPNGTSYYYFFYDWEVEGTSILCESGPLQVTVTLPVGIPEREAPTLTVYPDPADRDMFFDLDGYRGADNPLITVLDPGGRIVATKRLQQGRATLTTAWLAEGMYVYRITAATGVELFRGRFVVAH